MFLRVTRTVKSLGLLGEFKASVCQELAWTENKWSRMYTVRGTRLNSLESVAGGGACLFGALFTITDLENISNEVWEKFVTSFSDEMIVFLNAIHRPKNAYLPI